MNMKEQQYVCVLAECGSITRAAKELYISQPALSIYINNLEKSLNVKLFERVGKRFILTYAGERYVEKARAMLRLEEEFEEELKDITGNYTGRIRIGVQTRRATWLLPPVVAAYEQEFPNVDVILYEGIQGVLDQKSKKFPDRSAFVQRVGRATGHEKPSDVQGTASGGGAPAPPGQ